MILTIYKMCYIIALKNRKNIKNKQIIKKLVENQFIIQYNKNVDIKIYADSTPPFVMMTTDSLLN